MHRLPPETEPAKRQQWLAALGLTNDEVHDHHRVCSRHFPSGDISQPPSLHLGKRFASPRKMRTPRGERAVRAAKRKSLYPLDASTPKRLSTASPSPCTSRVVTPVSSELTDEDYGPMSAMQLCTPIGEVLLSDYNVHELPNVSEDSCPDSSGVSIDNKIPNEAEVIVNTALVARIEALEAENETMHRKFSSQKPKYFRLEDIANKDSLVRFYTGFQSHEILILFYEFLGPSVNNLHYWGSKSNTGRKRRMKLDPLNQLFLTLVKLRLNLRERDLAQRFGIAVSVVSKYFITWVCFLYCHLREVDWMPAVEQVRATLPHTFKDRYPKTYVIIDASEVFIETPNDLHLQSSTWSNYKHHNTVKFLVGCTPNGAVSFVSPLHVGSISDVELTRISGLLEQLEGKSNISVMADRGFTIRDQLSAIGSDLNIPPFMEGRAQLPAAEVLEGRKIASVRIHIERAIGRIKNFSILKGSLPITLSRIANQIVCVCCWLVNFQPILIPPPVECEETDVEEYFQSYYTSDSDYDADSEASVDDM